MLCFGETAGIQCACIALFSIAYSILKAKSKGVLKSISSSHPSPRLDFFWSSPLGFAKSPCYSFKNFSSTGSIFFIQVMCFAIIPFSSHYYIFDTHSCDNIGQASANGSSVLLKFLTIQHALNFITTTYLVNSKL